MDVQLDDALHAAFRTPLKSNANNMKASVLDIVRDDSMCSEGDFVTLVAVVVEVLTLTCNSIVTGYYILFSTTGEFCGSIQWKRAPMASSGDQAHGSHIEG